MIIAEQQIDQVNAAIFAELDYLKEIDNLPPARVRVTVRLPGADEIRDAHLKCVLYVQENNGANRLPWAEEGRLILSREETKDLQPFNSVFLVDKDYNIHIDFLVTQVTPEGEQEEAVGYSQTTLSKILSAEDERLDVELMSVTGVQIPDAFAELAIDWLKFFDDKMVLEVRIHIDRHSGWPFSSARPCFVVYKYERQFGWAVIHRSEVLTKRSAYPDPKGVVVFELCEISLKTILGGDHTRPLRLEFFHYKTKENQKMLGFAETSLRQLRGQARRDTPMKLEVGTVAEGELVGELRMVNSKISAGRSFFSLLASFGGEVVGNFVYFDIRLTDTKVKKGWRREKKPFFTIARYGDSRIWEKIYRSEDAVRVKGKLHKFEIAKLTERRLNGGVISRPISFMLFQMVGGRRVVIGHVETTLAALLDTDAGATLRLEVGNGNGYMSVEQTEETESRIYVRLHCVLDRGAERSSTTEEAVEEVSAG